jgi:hypothetical protein
MPGAWITGHLLKTGQFFVVKLFQAIKPNIMNTLGNTKSMSGQLTYCTVANDDAFDGLHCVQIYILFETIFVF